MEMEKSGQRPNEYFIYAQLLAYATAKPKEPARAERCIRNALEDWGSLGAVGGGWEAKGTWGDVNLYTMGCDLDWRFQISVRKLLALREWRGVLNSCAMIGDEMPLLIQAGLVPNQHILSGLGRALGRKRATDLLAMLGHKVPFG